MKKGKVKFFDFKRKFGFITAEDGTDYFFNLRACLMKQAQFRKAIKKDATFTFNIGQNEKGDMAIDVQLAD